MHADFREAGDRQPDILRDDSGAVRRFVHELVHEARLHGQLLADPVPLVVVDEPGRQHDLRAGHFLAGDSPHLGDTLHESLRAPWPAFRALTTALVIGPDPDRPRLEVGCPVELLSEDLQEIPHSIRLAWADGAWIPAAPAAARGPQFGRRVGIGLVADHEQRDIHSDPLRCEHDRPQPVAKGDGLRIVGSFEVVHVVPDDQFVRAPEGEIFDVSLDLGDRCGVVVVVEVSGEIDAPRRLRRHRRAPPVAGREASRVVAARPQKFPRARHEPAVVAAHDPHAASRPVLDPEALRADAVVRSELNHERRLALGHDLRVAAVGHLPGEDLREVCGRR